jgi:hypothetical protein
VAHVLSAQLDPSISPAERSRRLVTIAEKIEYWQHAAAKAARCHRRARLKRLRAMGIRVSRLKKCYTIK